MCMILAILIRRIKMMMPLGALIRMSYGMNKKIQRVKKKTLAALGYGGLIQI